MRENALHHVFSFADFKEAMAWMNRVGTICEEMNHHPDWCNSYNKVRVSLTTHDKQAGVTEKDIQLAKAMNDLAGNADGR